MELSFNGKYTIKKCELFGQAKQSLFEVYGSVRNLV